MAREANLEQRKVLDTKSGVLLNAGAGSGKTFVIIELLIEHFQKVLDDSHKSPNADLFIAERLSKVVVLTFTRKAAAELKFRLGQRVVDLVEIDEKWSIIHQSLYRNFVGTIDGFLSHQIKKGRVAGTSSRFEMVSAFYRTQEIENIVAHWFEDNIDSLEQGFSEIFDQLIYLQKSLPLFLSQVFFSTELRLEWGKHLGISKETLQKDFKRIIGLKNVSIPSPNDAPLGLIESKKDKASQLIKEYSSLQGADEDLIFGIVDLFKKYSGARKYRSTESHELVEYYLALKDVKDQYTSIVNSYTACLENVDHIGSIDRFFNLAFDELSERINQLEKKTFTDVEFEFLRAIKENPVNFGFELFIVDEFQDTSNSQFDLIKNVIDQDFHRLFCVGDEKQAIYGFRGGELDVFHECRESVPHPLELSNNYRSHQSIIKFNNELFRYLLPLGPGFSGVDQYPIRFVPQTFPSEKGGDWNRGRVCSHRLNCHFEEINVEQIERVEASHIASVISNLRDEGERDVAVLYRKIRPSQYLLSELEKRGIPYVAQSKFKYADDPILTLAYYLVLFLHEIEKKESHILSFEWRRIGSLLQYFGEARNLDDDQGKFLADVQTKGVILALKSLLYRSGFVLSSFETNFQKIEEYFELANSNLLEIIKIFEKDLDNTDQIHLSFGENEDPVQVMTVHASKGLEFENVVLGGLSTNGSSRAFTQTVGSYPRSFKWKNSLQDKSYVETPGYVVEKIERSLKDFSEQKRLFYVACTRAVKNLHFPSLFTEEGLLLYKNDNSWINGFHNFLSSNSGNELVKVIDHGTIRVDFSHLSEEISAPLFTKQAISLRQIESPERQICLITDLSVTRFASLASCPRKFYLKNICRLEESTQFSKDNRPETSSMNRGTIIHEMIAETLSHQHVLPLRLASLNEKDQTAIEWASSYIRENFEGWKLMIEEEIRFPIQHQMLSGTADLVCLSPDSSKLTVIDFKTGQGKMGLDSEYWTQLACYASHYMNQYLLNECELVLSYVDKKENKAKHFTRDSLHAFIQKKFDLLAYLDQKNLDHCDKCGFNYLCHPNP